MGTTSRLAIVSLLICALAMQAQQQGSHKRTVDNLADEPDWSQSAIKHGEDVTIAARTHHRDRRVHGPRTENFKIGHYPKS
jgi:hypothetical protein